MRERNCLISLTKKGRGEREKRGKAMQPSCIEPNPRGAAAELNRTQPQGGGEGGKLILIS